MPTLTVEGSTYYYALAGPADGKADRDVLFVHGAGGNHRHWLYQLQALKDSCRAYAVDLPGHGRSGGQPCDRVGGYREFIRLFAAHVLNDRPFYLVGHSMGGAITLDFARLYPDLLKGMVLVGTGARLRVLPELLETFRRGESYDLTPLAFAPQAPAALLQAGREEAASVPAAVYLADYTACDHFDLMNALVEIQVPALIISADRDLLTPLKYGRFLLEKLPRAQLAVVKGAGHMMMLEQPDQVNGYLHQFLFSPVHQVV